MHALYHTVLQYVDTVLQYVDTVLQYVDTVLQYVDTVLQYVACIISHTGDRQCNELTLQHAYCNTHIATRILQHAHTATQITHR